MEDPDLKETRETQAMRPALVWFQSRANSFFFFYFEVIFTCHKSSIVTPPVYKNMHYNTTYYNNLLKTCYCK